MKTGLERSRKFRKEHPGYYSDPCRNWRNANPDRSRECQRQWVLKNQDKARIHKKIFGLIKQGKLKREPCIVCGDPKSHAHHSDYSKPLQIEWLCHIHHRNKHQELNK